MFNRLVISGAKGIKTHKPWTVALSATVQVVIVFFLILIPMIYTEALDPRLAAMSLVTPLPPPQLPASPAAVKAAKARFIQLSKFTAPAFIPTKISIGNHDAPVIYSNNGMDALGATSNVLTDILGNSAPPPSKPAPPQRIRLGGVFEAGARINNVTPEYPEIVREAHISGTVVLHAVIAKDGTIEQLEYISGPPMLVKSAMDSVRQWRYKPYLLDGDPVEVETTINVDFNFGG